MSTVTGSRVPEKPLEEILEALEESGGFITDAAKRLGYRRETLSRIVNDSAYSDELQACIAEHREILLDDCEKLIAGQARDGDEQQLRFILSTLGKHRGYGRTVEHSGEVATTPQVVLYLPDNGTGGDSADQAG